MRIEVNDLSFTYSPKSPFEKSALKNVTFSVKEGETVAIIGSTGSGKSTLVQHLNGLIKIQDGTIKVGDIILKPTKTFAEKFKAKLGIKKPNFKLLRSKVGMLFQYPEYQLFEDTVLKDVMFGPKNFGMNNASAKSAAERALCLVGLSSDEIKGKSPFEISGGEKRRVAIAGVIASEPEVLILDEPTAGLDPVGKHEILDLVKRLKQGATKTVIMISHNMDEVAEYADRVIFVSNGEIVADGTPEEIFSHSETFEGTGLRLPHAAHIAMQLKQKGIDISPLPLTAEALSSALAKLLKGGYRHE